MKLNLGCGGDIRDSYVNVDVAALAGVDMVHDLDSHPWPFEDESCSEVLALDVFEHVADPLGFVAEIWRVLEPGGQVMVRAPHYGTWCAHTDPTHRRAVSPETFDYWIPGAELHTSFGDAYAQGCHFRKESVRRRGDNVEFVLSRAG